MRKRSGLRTKLFVNGVPLCLSTNGRMRAKRSKLPGTVGQRPISSRHAQRLSIKPRIAIAWPVNRWPKFYSSKRRSGDGRGGPGVDIAQSQAGMAKHSLRRPALVNVAGVPATGQMDGQHVPVRQLVSATPTLNLAAHREHETLPKLSLSVSGTPISGVAPLSALLRYRR